MNSDSADRTTTRAFDVPKYVHPHTNYTVMDAVKLVENTASLINQPPPASLHEVRERILEMLKRTPHQWITGYAALDVLDAVIDGVDLRQHSRLP